MDAVAAAQTSRPDVRAAILDAAAQLLRDQGPAGVTTRGVAQAAGVQAPTIYRLFGDKDGLIAALAERVFVTYLEAKVAHAGSGAADLDPIGDLRLGWEMHIDFGLANPALYELMNTPRGGQRSPAVADGIEVLRARVRRLAVAGMLRVGEQRAVEIVHAMGSGAVLALLHTPADKRDLGLADAIWDAMTHAILIDAAVTAQQINDADDVATAVTFRTVVPRLPTLTDVEKAMLCEWLDRAIDTPPA